MSVPKLVKGIQEAAAAKFDSVLGNEPVRR